MKGKTYAMMPAAADRQVGIKWLSVYIAIRPGALLNIQEKHIDTNSGLLFIPHPKEKKPKIIPLLAEDIELLKAIPKGLPDLYFFRHGKGIQSVQPGDRFGQRYFQGRQGRPNRFTGRSKSYNLTTTKKAVEKRASC